MNPQPNEVQAVPAAASAPPVAPAASARPTAPAQSAEPDTAQRSRRVGTFTMGLTLIASGTLFLLSLFFPQINIFSVLRFFPLVLIMLGAEILVYNAKYKTDAFRYDFVSVFLCLLLVGASAVTTVASQVWYRHVRVTEQQTVLQRQLEDASYNALGRFEKISSLRAHVYTDWRAVVNDSPALETLPPGYAAGFSIVLDGSYATEQDFANDCRTLIDALYTVVPRIDEIEIHSGNPHTGQRGGRLYSFRAYDRFAMQQASPRLADEVDVAYWNPEYEIYENHVFEAPDEPEFSDPEEFYSLPESSILSEPDDPSDSQP